MNLRPGRFTEIATIVTEAVLDEKLYERQNAAFTAWSILTRAFGLKTGWDKFLSDYHLQGKPRVKLTEEQIAQQASAARTKAQKIINLDPHRFERTRQRREGK